MIELVMLDFFSGSHGHFIEYVVNTYLFKGPSVANVLTSTGTSHNIRHDSNYMNSRIVKAAHYSEHSLKYPAIDNSKKVIRVGINDTKGHACYQLNVINRAGDQDINQKELYINETIRNTPVLLRNDYYSKFSSSEFGYQTPGRWKFCELAVFNFDMTSCYNIHQFYYQLSELAKFLNQTFTPDNSLSILWQHFIAKNHGLQAWQRCEDAFFKIVANEDCSIHLSIPEQALLNFMLSRCFSVYDGPLFANAAYPTNTQAIWYHIQQHINTFDERF